MKSYGQFCPVAKAAQVFCERWTALIIRDLAWGATRFSELQRGVPLMSPSVLAQRLRQLEKEGVIERRPVENHRTWTYHLTEAGRGFVPLIEGLGVWGQQWTRRELEEHELDLNLTIWALERSVDATAFGPGRCVVEIDFTDQPERKRRWWFVNENDSVELCVKAPGYEIDLYLSATLRDMTYILRGDLSVSRAVESGRLRLHGAPRRHRAVSGWFNLSPLAAIGSRRADADAM